MRRSGGVRGEVRGVVRVSGVRSIYGRRISEGRGVCCTLSDHSEIFFTFIHS